MATANVSTKYISWKTEKVAQKVGRKPRLYPEGHPLAGSQMRGKPTKSNTDGPLLWSPETIEKDLEFPVLNRSAITDPSDLSWIVQEILDEQKPGFTTLVQILDYIEHGMYRGPAVLMNKGQDIRLSASQIEAINTMVGVYKKGLMTDVDQIVSILERQGIPDARRELQVRLDVDETEDEGEEIPTGK